jgi:hypothetical protein
MKGHSRAAAEQSPSAMNDERIIAYLLEELSPEEAARFEEECFTAEVWPGEVSLAEDELIEDYLRDELSPERHQRFEHHYLTTAARRERVRVAAALIRHASAAAPAEEAEVPAPELTSGADTFFERLRAFWGGHAWAPRAAVALLIVVAFAAAAWWLTRPPAPRSFVALTLAASRGERGAGERPASVPLPRGDEALSVTLLLPEGTAPAARYRVELEDARGAATPLEPATPEAQQVSVVIPAARLARGAYALKLYALDDDGPPRRVGGSYFFNVE